MLFITFQSCAPAKLVKDDKLLLHRNKISLSDSPDKFKKGELRNELDRLVIDKPNKDWIGIPREWLHLKLLEEGDLNKVQTYVFNRISEKPVFYDSTHAERSSYKIAQYLRNKKGFYNASVDYSVRNRGPLQSLFFGKKKVVDYEVDLKDRSYVRSSVFFGNDFDILEKLISNKDQSFIKPGTPIDAFTFDLEKQRIVNYLQNQGYANFNSNHISIKGDSTTYNKQIEIFIEILNPSQGEKHQSYSIGEINVFTDHHQTLNDVEATEEKIYGKQYLYHGSDYLVNPAIIDNKISIKENELYSRENYYQSLRQLTSLEAYRFVKISPKLSELSDTIIDYDILLTPQNYKWVGSLNNDFFYSTVNSIGRKLIGLSLGGALENRNTFGGSEVYSLTAESSAEFNLSGISNQDIPLVNSASTIIQNVLDIPKMWDMYKSVSVIRAMRLIDDNDVKKIRSRTDTKLNLGFTYQETFNYYTLNAFNASYGFDYNPNNTDRAIITQTGVDLILYRKEKLLLDILDNIQILKNSFNNTLFTGIFFQKFSYIRNSRIPYLSTQWSGIFDLEVSGLEIAGINEIYNAFSPTSRFFKLNDELDFANFIRLETDQRFMRPLTETTSLAFRFSSGIAFDYFNDNAVPYIRQFYNGGPSSIRAWQPREMGPGGYGFQLENPDDQQPFFQSGDFKVETNIEYRFDLFSVLEAALFLDAGNIWTLVEDPARPDAHLTSSFISQLAVGAGYGLRLDFDYFLIRFDFGYKIRNPYISSDGSSRYPAIFKQGFGNVNLAINYPF